MTIGQTPVNAPHHPELPGFPHHIHIGATGTVEPGSPIEIYTVLDEIARAQEP